MNKPLIQNRIAHFSQKRDPRDFSLDGNKSDSTGGSEQMQDSLFGRLSSFFSKSKDGTTTSASDSSAASSKTSANDQYKAKMEKSNL